MTVEHRIVIGLEDIKAISFACATDGCQYLVTMSPDDFCQIPGHCINGHGWSLGVEEISQAAPIQKFTASLRQIRVLVGQKATGFKILLQVDEATKH